MSSIECEYDVDVLINLIEMNTKMIKTFEHNIQVVRGLEQLHVSSDIQSMKFVMMNECDIFKKFKKIFDDKLDKMCNNLFNEECSHLWEDDYIDGLNYDCKKITYCIKCYSTK
jgi:hypothetical protein